MMEPTTWKCASLMTEIVAKHRIHMIANIASVKNALAMKPDLCIAFHFQVALPW